MEFLLARCRIEPTERRRSVPLATGAGYLAAGVLACLSGVHAYWALGGRRGTAAVVPTRRADTHSEGVFVPGTAATWAVSGALCVAGCVLIGRVRGWQRGRLGLLFEGGAWLVAAAFCARAIGDFRYVGLFKRVRGTPFAARDTLVYVPLCLLVAGLSATAAAGRAGGAQAAPAPHPPSPPPPGGG